MNSSSELLHPLQAVLQQPAKFSLTVDFFEVFWRWTSSSLLGGLLVAFLVVFFADFFAALRVAFLAEQLPFPQRPVLQLPRPLRVVEATCAAAAAVVM